MALGPPAVLAWVGTCLYFWYDDRLALFKTVMLDFNRDYAGDLGENLAGGRDLRAPVARVTSGPRCRCWRSPWPASRPGGLRDLRRWLPVLAYLAGAVVMVALPGRWWAHYYQLYLPPLVLGAAFGLASLEHLPAPGGRRLRAAGLAAAFAFGLAVNLSQLALDGDAASWRKYRGRFLAVRETAFRASALLREGETVFMYGIEPGIYFHTRRRPVAQVLWLNHLTGPLRVPLRHTLRRQLREVRPDLIVRDTRFRTCTGCPRAWRSGWRRSTRRCPRRPRWRRSSSWSGGTARCRARAAGLL